MNFVLLTAFTLCEAWMVAGITCFYHKEEVILAGAATALTTLALTIYAIRTKTNIEIFGAMLWVLYLAMLPLWIIGLVIRTEALNILYCAIGLVFYSIYLIVDTMMIVRDKKSLGGYGIDHEDYIVAALMLYIDIVMIFVYILRLLGSSRN